MLIALLAAAAAAGLVLAAALVFRRLGRDTPDTDPDGATGGHAGAMLSALFLLTVAIAIVVPWTTADAARQNTLAEGQAMIEAYWSAGEIPAPAGDQVRAALEDYARFVRDQEWPLLSDGRLRPEGWSRIDAVRNQVTGIRPADDDVREARTAVLDQVRNMSAARHQRAMDAQSTPPAGLFILTLVTGVAVILFPFLAGARPQGMRMVSLVVMAGLLGVSVWLTFAIASAFDGPIAVTPEAFSVALQEFQRITAGG